MNRIYGQRRLNPKYFPSFCTGEHDTTVRLKYPLAKYPHLTTTDALHTFMTSTFGPVDKDTIVLSIKPPKKAASAAQQQHKHRPPKYATAAVPFKTVADAHAAVCASGRADRGLEEFEIGWMAGREPAVWSWSERMMLRSKEAEVKRPAPPPVTVTPARGVDTAKSERGGRTSSPGTGSQFSSFPSSFVRGFFFFCLL
jgi:DnaJ homolog subfamily C member 17